MPTCRVSASAACASTRHWPTAIEYDVGHKILFGSDYPYAGVDDSVRYLYDASRMAARAGLPPIPETYIEDMLERDSLQLLGMA